ncbi:MAG TPA: hypothetical protein PK951_00350, partial [Chitinophagaceae bacterium]|nr:hypothetical protein [Chitinophagaceae bacterium]
VLENGADYFSSDDEVTGIINTPRNSPVQDLRRNMNIDRIRTVYNIEKNIADYERLMLESCRQNNILLTPAATRLMD